jgi:hypothetical protein
MPARSRHARTEDWQQITQLCLWPEQRRYELLRPVVLYGDLCHSYEFVCEMPFL